MKRNDKKIKEPFPPEKTPAPPQIIDPNLRNERGENTSEADNANRRNNPDKQPKASGKKLGDETEIDDETTI